MADEEVTKKGTKKTSTKSSEKKVATGSTKRIVQSRSSSTAGKKTTAKKESVAKTVAKAEKSTPKTTRKKVSAESDEKSKKSTATKKDAAVKHEETAKKATSKNETAKRRTTKKAEKQVDEEIKEKELQSTTSKRGKHSLSTEEVSNVEKVLEEAIETAKQEILKKAREENKIEIPTIEELLKRAGITETESLINKKDTPKREEFLSLEEEEELEIEEDNDLDEIEEFEDDEELEEDEEDFEEEDFEDDDSEEEYEEEEDFEDEDEEDDEYDEIEEEEEVVPRTRLQRRREREITEVVGKEIKKNKKVADVELGKIHTRVFQNICLAVAMMLYLNFVVLGFVNIENPVFVTDLKVFSIALLVIAVGVFEYAYKKDSGRHALHGIEILMLAFSTMALIYVNLMWTGKFVYIVALITFLFAIYYVAKSIIVYKKMKKQYFINEMKKVIKRR